MGGLFQFFSRKWQEFPGIGPPLAFWPFMVGPRAVMALVGMAFN